jgi:hypothetical protein
MSLLAVENFKDETKYEQLAKIKLTEIVNFVSQYYSKKFSPVIGFHYLITFTALAGLLWSGWQSQSLDKFLTHFGFGVISFFLLLPFHEWLHGITYQYFGAKDVRYKFELRKMLAYAVAHNFIADRREFTWVALMPTIVINCVLTLLTILFPVYQLYFLTTLLLHISGTSGDFALLNFLWVHRDREVYTYDDADSQVSYFYATKN